MMGTITGNWGCNSEEYSNIKEKGAIGFLDYEVEKLVGTKINDEDDPVVISFPFSPVNGMPPSVFVGETAFDTITIKNATHEPVDMWGVNIFASSPDDSFTLSLVKPPPSKASIDAAGGFSGSFSLEDRILQPGETLTIWLSCKPTEIGLHVTSVQFDVGDERIERVAFLLADNKISRSLTSSKRFSRRKKKEKFVENYVAATPPVKPRKRGNRNKLPPHDISKNVRKLLENGQIPDSVQEGLTKQNYASFFKTLLMMEEIEMEEEMRSYDMEYVTMRKTGNHFLALQVPGLAERRPSLVHGDSVFANQVSAKARKKTQPHQGYVHRVEANEVYLKFAEEFHLQHRKGNLYNVHFTYNRANMRRFYQALDAIKSLSPNFLFPSEYSKRRLIKSTAFLPISENLNGEQMYAVQKILSCKGAPPYVIHGPPGTGKTMTVVEAIIQLYTKDKNVRILVCAPSNSAADLVLEKLLNKNTIGLSESEVFRLNASTRSYEDVRPQILRFCCFNNFLFKCPPVNFLAHYRIVISTFMSSSLLSAVGIRRGHFTHIFLDEAGQASEPETLVPISNLCKKETVVVLAGDPMQLGPVIYSQEAASNGLGKSYLERLFECQFYSNGDENYVTKLVRNYRSHPEILYLPSLLFYGGELIPCRDEERNLMKIDLLPNKEFPVLFFGIQGCDEREGNNPSWFNRIEASKVIEVVKRLTADGNIGEEDIGIITPYRQQVIKLKKAFESTEMFNIKIGSVEQFQGQERQVIIISTVRSTIKHNELDKAHCLGFLSNKRRFNVALTRAISLLIIIGNPHIIHKDSNWNKLLWRCVDNSSYIGCSLPERRDIDDDDDDDNDDDATSLDSDLTQEEETALASET